VSASGSGWNVRLVVDLLVNSNQKILKVGIHSFTERYSVLDGIVKTKPTLLNEKM